MLRDWFIPSLLNMNIWFQAMHVGDDYLAASWSESGKVHIWDLKKPLQAVNDHKAHAEYMQWEEGPSPLFTFSGHQVEGFALDWCRMKPGNICANCLSTLLGKLSVLVLILVAGWLATGDCSKNIHVWQGPEGGEWQIDQRPFVGHTASVEDIQWSPNEASVS